VAFISSQNHPILVRTFVTDANGDRTESDLLKAHYAAHTSLDVFDERVGPNIKSMDCYLGLLYVLDEIAVYGYLTPTKLKIVVALTVTDAVVKDSEVMMLFRALHTAFYRCVSNPFLRLGLTESATNDTAQLLKSTRIDDRTKALQRRVDEIARAVGPALPTNKPSMF